MSTSLASALAELARALRAELDTEALRIEHVDPAGELSASGKGGALELSVVFARPLKLELGLRRLREQDLWDLFHDPALSFDDSAFDEAFLVRGEPADSVRTLLDAETRALLLSINGRADDLGVDPQRLTVVCSRLDGSVVELAEDVLALARRLLGVQSVQKSAYR